jgi:asparagine synthetase B (glutamine-hydrolysing)
MRSADGSLSMVFNGEVYNFATIRAELEALGHRFRSSGDSEVILAALSQVGMRRGRQFVGMFAIAHLERARAAPAAAARPPGREAALLRVDGKHSGSARS